MSLLRVFYKFFRLFSGLVLIFIPIVLVNAQSGSTTGKISGTVKDSQGRVIVGATIKVKQHGTGHEFMTKVDEKGLYALTELPADNYEVTVEAEGFNVHKAYLPVNIGSYKEANFILGIGKQPNIIIVITVNELVESNKTEVSTLIRDPLIRALPINRRNFLDLAFLVAGVTPDQGRVEGVSTTSGLSGNGQSGRVNNLTIDGLDNNDFASGSVRSTFSQDAVQEFLVVSSNYSAEFGRALGVVINVGTKSGSKEYHSNLFLINRNDKISARDVFAASKSDYSQYQFGLNLGGPIKKDKVFFFAAFERLSIKQNNIVTISDDLVNAALRQGFTLRNGSIPFSIGTTTALTRVKWLPTSNDILEFRYNFAGTYNGALEPFGGLIGDTNAGIQRLKDNSFAFNNLKSFSRNSFSRVNETRFLYNRRNQNVSAVDNGPEIQAEALEGAVNFGRNTFLPQPRVTNTYQITNTSSIVKGDKEIKFGIDFLYFNNPKGTTELPILAGGLANFSPIDFSMLTGIPKLPSFSLLQSFDPTLRTPSQLAFLMSAAVQIPMRFPGFPKNIPLANLALPIAYLQGFGNPRAESTGKLLSLFLQANIIKVKQRLFLNTGIRYDINRIKFLPRNNGNFSPRIALSYKPTNKDNLNIHAQYGLFFGVPQFGPAIGAELSSSGAFNVVSVPFPFSVLPYALPGHHFQESERLPESVAFAPQLSQSIQTDRNIRNSYAQEISFGIDYAVGNHTIISADYKFIRGIKLLSSRNINPIVYPIQNDPIMSAITGRVDPTRGNVIEFESSFDSYYHGFSIAVLSQRIKDRFTILANYTLSKAIDNFINLTSNADDDFANPLKPGNERGLSVQDVRQRFVLAGILQFGFTKKKLGLNGFQLSTIVNVRSGTPYNVLAGTDLDMNGDNGGGDRPLLLGRNVGILPKYINFDVRLSRSIIIERYKFEGFVDIFNLFNRTNINDINNNFPPDSQGHFNLPPMRGGRYISTPDRYISALPSRQFQVGLRLNF